MDKRSSRLQKQADYEFDKHKQSKKPCTRDLDKKDVKTDLKAPQEDVKTDLKAPQEDVKTDPKAPMTDPKDNEPIIDDFSGVVHCPIC
ncbi:hypothetical protein A2U01_0057781 [Trifolium medium]|uniref:Uncharacterized protein n=1 Tax=Trifolium medium TaxID=97028 RepID=A0A392RIZ1_9FABA|nr:hypothetical protein [Trifolium medium]